MIELEDLKKKYSNLIILLTIMNSKNEMKNALKKLKIKNNIYPYN